MTNHSVQGGPAVPAKVVLAGDYLGGPAIPVYQILDGDGYQVRGGPSIPMRLITDPAYPRIGGPALPIKYIFPEADPQGQGGLAVPVYCVNYADLINAMSTFDWFVDSVNGNDGNTGKSISQAYKIIAALTSISDGDRIGLARGSTWREQLTITVDNVKVGAYGAGNKPIIDCRDAIPNASFTKTVGRTNVYEVSLSPDLVNPGTWNSTWEGTTRLVRATSIANCDATPGSYIPTSDILAPITMYIHATDSSDITANGKVYQYAHRQFSLESYGFTGVEVKGINTIGNLGVDGSIRMGSRSRIIDCLVEEGNKHNIYFGDGSYLQNVVTHNAYYGGASFTHFVFNENSPVGLGVTFDNCEAYNDVNPVEGTGFYGHVNVGGNFGTVIFNNCTGHNLFKIFSGDNATFILNNCSVTATTQQGFIFAAGCNVTVNGGSFTMTTYFAGMNANQSLMVDGATIVITGGYDNRITANVDNATIDLENCTITADTGYFIYNQTAVGFVLTMNNCVFNGNGHYVYIKVPFTYVGDYNQFVNGRTFEVTGGGGTLLLAGWQALTGQDANST